MDDMALSIEPGRLLPSGGEGKRSSGWWGVCALIVTEASLFGYLLFSYFYLASQSEQQWPPEGLPKLGIGSVNTIILIASSVLVWASERCIKLAQPVRSRYLLTGGIVLGILFVTIQMHEWGAKSYGMTSNIYGALYFTITGFHMLHVIVGLIILSLLLLWNCLGYFNPQRFVAVKIGGLYWHFVDVVWLFVFTTIYLTPYLAESVK